jgi:hypothetical protein
MGHAVVKTEVIKWSWRGIPAAFEAEGHHRTVSRS